MGYLENAKRYRDGHRDEINRAARERYAKDLTWRNRKRRDERKRYHSIDGRDKYLRKRFGITLENYEQLLDKQRGLCAICGNKPDNRRLAVDHNHNTGEIRGLLCDYCNNVLVAALDHPNFPRAVDYIRSYGA